MQKINISLAALVLAAPLSYGHEDFPEIEFMQCEHLDSPVGIDAGTPRLSWMLPDGVVKQTGYQVVVGTDSAGVASFEGNMWNSGIVESDDVLVRYSGIPLEPFTRYFWKVTAWDQDQTAIESGVDSGNTSRPRISERNFLSGKE